MTQAQFLNGTSFRVVDGFSNYKGGSTFRYSEGGIVEENRSSIDEKVLVTTYLCNVTKIGSKGFEGFTFILSKKVKVKYKFEDLAEFIQEA